MTEIIYLKEKDVALHLNVSVKKLQKDRQLQQGLPCYKFGRSILYNSDEIKSYMASQRAF